MKTIFTVVLVWLYAFGMAIAADPRDAIRIVGSPAVLPFIQTVAENFSLHFNNAPPPSIDVTGAGRGFQHFCSGVGYQHPDINATARAITDAELTFCRDNGVDEIIEIVVGLDAIALASSTESEQVDFTVVQLFSALSAQIAQKGELIDNPHQSWSDVNSKLPEVPIRVMGPAPTSSYYDAFTNLVMRKGCDETSNMPALSEEAHFKLCHYPRRDGAFISGMNTDSSLLQWIRQNPDAFAFVPLHLLIQYPEVIRANRIKGAAPEPEQIANGGYSLARPIFIYIKRQHMDAVTGLQEFLYELTSERAVGPEGYLSNSGFSYLDDRGRNKARDAAISLQTLDR